MKNYIQFFMQYITTIYSAIQTYIFHIMFFVYHANNSFNFFAINSAEVLKHVKLIAKCELLFENII